MLHLHISKHVHIYALRCNQKLLPLGGTPSMNIEEGAKPQVEAQRTMMVNYVAHTEGGLTCSGKSFYLNIITSSQNHTFVVLHSQPQI